MKVATFGDYGKKPDTISKALEDSKCTYFDHLNVAVVRPDPGTNVTALSTSIAGDSDVSSVRPEFYMYTCEPLRERYQAWVREGIRLLADGAVALDQPARGSLIAAAPVASDTNATWGIKAVRADESALHRRRNKGRCTGHRVRHESSGFLAAEMSQRNPLCLVKTVDDGNGHGTHCIGTSSGPRSGDEHPRYGVAVAAHIFAGKVLSNRGSGRESWILAGMEWAIQNGCEVISMSLGRETRVGEAPDPLYEAVGKAALDNGSLIIAASGNSSARHFGHIAPVGAPANSPSIMAVAAVDNNMQIANFSCGGINDNGGEVNIAGPGVDVFSSFPLPERYKRLAGTSMATPHVAGVAAMLAESDANLRGQLLWDALRRTALDIGLPIRDGGAGLVQAPGRARGC